MKIGKSVLLKAAVIAVLMAILLISAADALTNSLELKRERELLPTVLLYCKTYHLSPALVLAVIKTESEFHPRAVSRAGAMGLMQLMPDTFFYLAKEKLGEDRKINELFDPSVNLHYGCYYLSYLFERFEDKNTVLAAYNAGEGRVMAWLNDPALAKDGRLINIPFSETAAYVKSINNAERAYQNKYHF